MNKKLLFLILLGAVLTTPFVVQAAVVSIACGVTAGGTALDDIITRAANATSAIGAGIAVIGFIIAGIMYLTAAGGERLVTAKKALIAAVIGTALVALAQGSKIMTDIFCKIITG